MRNIHTCRTLMWDHRGSAVQARVEINGPVKKRGLLRLKQGGYLMTVFILYEATSTSWALRKIG